MTKDRGAMTWKEKIASLNPEPKTEHSPARVRIHADFDEIAAAKERGVTWQQLTDLFTAEGIVGGDGEPLTADAVRSLFHSERYARGERRKRRATKTMAQPQTQAPVPPPITPDPDDEPRKGAFRAIPSRPRK